jgi:hypothetical protein
MNTRRLALATILGVGLISMLLWLLSTSSNLTLAQADTDIIPVAMDNSGTSAQDSAVNPRVTTIVISNNVGLYNSLAVDSNGHLHASFNNSTTTGLFYAVYSDTTWHVQAVDTGSEILRNSIAVDPNSGAPHISYEKSEDIRYARLSGSRWISSTVEGIGQRYKQNAIAVDSSGYPHIAYSRDYQVGGGFWFGKIRYARLTDTVWVSETLDADGEAIHPPIALALDSQDNPHVLYKKRYYGGYYGVFLQRRITSTWQRDQLEYGWYITLPPGAALTIDDSDNIYWAYMWNGQKVGGTILPKTSLAYGTEIGYSDIATDDSGRVYVVFENGNTLQLAVRSACGWIQMPLVSISAWGQSDVSLVVTQGVVHVIYYDGATHSLMHLSMPVVSFIGHLAPLYAQPNEMVADGNSTATVTATVTVTDCVGDSLASIPVTLTLNPSLDSAFIYPQTGTMVHSMTGVSGTFSATLKAGLQVGIITVTVTADNLLPQSTAIRLHHIVPGVELAPDRAGSANPGSVITYTHILTNTGNGSDTFHLTHHSSQGWAVEYDTPVTVGRWQTVPITISVTVPAGVISGTLDTTVITATSQTDPNVSASVTDTTRTETHYTFVYLPVVIQAYWNPVEGDEFYIGQRSSSSCAEHDSYVVPVATAIESNMLPMGAEITAQYRIRATHPVVEVHPLDALWHEWCDADWTDCPSGQQSVESITECEAPIQSADTITLVWDECDGQEQIYVLDSASDIGTLDVIVNGKSYGQHTGVIFGSRWGSAESWNHDGVIYANGFTRWKPKGEEPGEETDPCFGTSVVLGPFQLDKPFLSDGYSPNPLRHPKIEEINIAVCPGWQVQMTGAFFEEGQRLMNVSWSIERLNISSSEMLVSVSQDAAAVQNISLYQVFGQFGIGQVEMSSMYAESPKHDADNQIGPGHEIWVENISNSSEGLWGQENSLHHLPEESSLCLETKTPTTHNTGSPTLCILWDLGADATAGKAQE